jgi:hypothetical protein
MVKDVYQQLIIINEAKIQSLSLKIRRCSTGRKRLLIITQTATQEAQKDKKAQTPKSPTLAHQLNLTQTLLLPTP